MMTRRDSYKKMAGRLLGRLGLLAVALVALAALSPAAPAHGARSRPAPLPPPPWDATDDRCKTNFDDANPRVDVSIRVPILDESGNFKRYSSHYKVRVTGQSPLGTDGKRIYTDDALSYTNQNLDSPGIPQQNYWNHYDKTVSREYEVDSRNGVACAMGGEPAGRKLIFNQPGYPSSYPNNPNRWVLDCMNIEPGDLPNAPDGASINIKIEILEVYDAGGPGLIEYRSPTSVVITGHPNGGAFNVPFTVVAKRGAIIQGLKVVYQGSGTPASNFLPGPIANGITVNAQGGGRTQTGACLPDARGCNGYQMSLPAGSYDVFSSPTSLSGWKMAGFYIFDRDNRFIRFQPISGGNYRTDHLSGGGLINVWVAYEPESKFYPWLQTQGGNIVSLGKITGQQIGQYGGRDAASAQKEAEYLIISRVSTASFCSTNHYMLAGVSTGCNGGKYEINPETLPIVNGEDRVISGLTDAWTKNGSGTNVTNCTARNQYFTQALGGHGGVLNNLPSANVSQVSSGARCANGTIWRHNGNTRMNSITYDAGRGTIWVKGNLNINGDIKRAAASAANADEVPNLGIIVEGNISIAPGVKQIDAAIYSTGKISTCSESNNPSAGRCKEKLTVNGLLAATNGFDYGRRFVSNFGGGSGDPAELVRYSGQILAFPPPGFGYFDAALSTKIKYLGEFNPRF